LEDTGATLPARDAVDLRLVRSVRDGTGKVLEKETDLPEDQRWPDYRSLPPPADADGDGIPDFWERQFGLNPNDADDASKISAGGYANIEHYINNTDPTGKGATLVYVSASVSRALVKEGQAGEWRVSRNGDLSQPLEVSYTLGGSAVAGEDCEALAGKVIIPAGQRTTTFKVTPLKTAHDDRTVVLQLQTGDEHWKVGCPSSSLIVIRNR
jgi:hypothetical protein